MLILGLSGGYAYFNWFAPAVGAKESPATIAAGSVVGTINELPPTDIEGRAIPGGRERLLFALPCGGCFNAESAHAGLREARLRPVIVIFDGSSDEIPACFKEDTSLRVLNQRYISGLPREMTAILPQAVTLARFNQIAAVPAPTETLEEFVNG